MHTGTLIRICSVRISEARELQSGCALNDCFKMSPLDAGFRKRTVFEFSCASPDPVEIMLMRFKNKEKWNGAGTFAFLVTLMKMNDVKSAREGLRGLSWRTDYD